MRILFVVPYPINEAPSQRFRFEHYLEFLKDAKINFHFSSFWDRAAWRILYESGHKWKKSWYLFKGFIRRFFLLFRLPFYRFVFVHREATPVGPAWFEWIAARLFRKKIIYDFDDAIWIPAISRNNKMVKGLRNFGKVANICRWSYKISVGNDYLAAYARQSNSQVIVIPTVVNSSRSHNKCQAQQTSTPAIGWTGSFSTLKYLDIVLPVIQELQAVHDFTFIVVADKDPNLSLKNYRFIKWKKASEVDDLLNFHIGLMPLFDDELSKGKCGFKAIQYMSLCIPAVVSPVGVNTKIVEDGVNGYICGTGKEWKEKLENLLKDYSLRRKMGEYAREKIKKEYSVEATRAVFLNLFN